MSKWYSASQRITSRDMRLTDVKGNAVEEIVA
jgi:hypothetical protein